MIEELLLMDAQWNWLLEIEFTLGEEAMNIVKMIKGLEGHINVGDKEVSGFDRIDYNCERNSTMDKMLSNSTAYYREHFC